jgi:hypothetical protein
MKMAHPNTMFGGKKYLGAERRISFPVRCSGELTRPVRLMVEDITLSM